MRTQDPPLGYVMTHYPRVALSFISGEIDEIEALGGTIHPIAMNLPDPADLLSEDARSRKAKTYYLKQRWPGLIGTFVGSTLRNPVGMTRLLGTAIASSSGSIPIILRRLSHLVQAASVAKICTERNITHLHAHFGQAPATIAWFATDILNFDHRSRRTWSFTIHGFHDFVDTSISRLDLKAASAAFVICISDFTRSQLLRLIHPSFWPRARVIRCGIDLDAFALRAPLPQSMTPKLVSVGRLASEKGQIVLLEACKMLLDRGQNLALTFVGSGPLEGLLRDEIARLDMQANVQLTGELPPEKVRQELETADLFCLTSFAEGLPISIMEAMAIGVPVITTAISGIPELVIDGKTGRTVPPGNVEALADAIADVLTNRGMRDRLIRGARQRVECHHERHRNVAELYELFSSHIGANDGPT